MDRRGRGEDEATRSFRAGLDMLRAHPLFAPLLERATVVRRKPSHCPREGLVVVDEGGCLHVHPVRRAEPDEWAHALAHALLHLGLGHVQRRGAAREWNAACCVAVARFLRGVRVGRPPESMILPDVLPQQDEESLARSFELRGVPDDLAGRGAAGPAHPDMLVPEAGRPAWSMHRTPEQWTQLFADAVRGAVAAGLASAAGARPGAATKGRAARAWFIDRFPLLGALAVAFDIEEDGLVLQRMGISCGAVQPSLRRIYLASGRLDPEECRFVMAHELLHVGLRHEERCGGRIAFLWNVACDYVINGWLVEMGVGTPPAGLLHDPDLKGQSAEAVYDLLLARARHHEDARTMRGVASPDILDDPSWRGSADGVTLDEFCRRALMQGLAEHEAHERGFLPAGLVEEIRALAQPPIPWEVELARWFDGYVRPLETRRTYARPSRRQQATPDIPRPRAEPREMSLDGRTFGVVIDTSGSMSAQDIGRALGAVASYAASRDVARVRVVFCDAGAHDAGWLSPDDVAGRVRVTGRGGTVLQPAIDLLAKDEGFPPDGPILLVTDGRCDVLKIRRSHAFLLTQAGALPFAPVGPVFRMS